MTTTTKSKATPCHSPAPWSYEYSPYRTSLAVRQANGDEEGEIPAFEVLDANYEKVFDTNEHTPAELQEANAMLAVLFPDMLAALTAFVELDDLAHECCEWKWENLEMAFKTARALLARINSL